MSTMTTQEQQPATEQATATDFEPRIVGLVCNWCSYAGADLAGTSRIQYPPNIRLVRVMCTGSIDPLYILRPLLDGADGVLVGGWHPGDCHYGSGNYKARRRIAVLKKTLESFGMDKERVWFRFISASEGKTFAETVDQMVQTLKKLGPNPTRNTWEL